MKPQNDPRKIVAYVESYDDVLFWRYILNAFETSTRYFEILLPAYGHLGRGKKSALKMLLSNTGKDMIACVDADYDYLLQRRTLSSRQMLNNPFVFHTYAYSIENMQCYAPGLHNVCVMATLNDKRIFDIQDFMKRYSEIIHPLFVLSIWLYRHKQHQIMTLNDMDIIITPGHFSINDADVILRKLQNKVANKISWIKSRLNVNDLKKKLNDLAHELECLGVSPENTYMYVHGHFLFNKVVIPILTNICNSLRTDREQEIKDTALHSTQQIAELSCYSASIEKISSMLKKNTAYLMSPECQRIMADLREKLKV